MRWLNVFLVILLILESIQARSFAEILRVKKGDKIEVPFDGRLVPDSMFEKMVKAGLQLEACNKKLSLIKEEQEKLCEVKINLERETCNIRLNFHKEYESLLEEQIRKDAGFWKSPLFYFIIGTVITVATVWGLSYAYRK